MVIVHSLKIQKDILTLPQSGAERVLHPGSLENEEVSFLASVDLRAEKANDDPPFCDIIVDRSI